MKTTLLSILGVLLFFPIGLNSQNTTNKIKTYKVWITLVDGSKEKGIIYSADKEGIKIISNDSFDVSNLISIDARKLNIIKIRRKGKVGRGVWIGAVSGMVVGALAGFADGDDPEDQWFRSTASEKALGLGLTGAVIGTGVGPLIASKKEIIIINGLFRNYEIKLKEIQSYSLKPFKD